MDNTPTGLNTECWQCGRPAEPGAAYNAVLVAEPSRAGGTMGFPVRKFGRLDQIRVPVPRCRACRTRNRASVVTVFYVAAGGAAVAPAVWSDLGLRGRWPDMDSSMVVIGSVLGFAVAIAGVAWRRRWLHLRSIMTYPPIVALRTRGWWWPSD